MSSTNVKVTVLALAGVALALAFTSETVAQYRGGWGNRPEDLLRRSDVRKELELVDEQIQQLDELDKASREGWREAFSGLQDLSREERAEKMREIFTQRSKERSESIDEILLPHQAQRLSQLVIRNQLRGSTSNTLANGDVAEKLGISDEQKENLRKKAQELQVELTKKIAEIRKEMQQELLNELTPQQRAQWKELIGEDFEFQSQRSSGWNGRQRQSGDSGRRPSAE